MKKFAIILLGVFSIFCSYAQQANKDSLLNLLSTAKEDTNKVLLYIEIGNQYELDDFNTAAHYYLLAKDLSQQLNYKRGIVKFVANYTAILNVKGAFDSSLLLNKQAIQISHELNDDLLLAKATANTGNCFNYLGQYDSAAYYYETAKSYFEKIQDGYFVARMNDLIQNVFWKLNQFAKGISYGKEASQYFRTEGKEMELGQALVNLANNYQSLQIVDSAMSCYKEGLAIGQRTGFKRLELTCLLGLGAIYFHRYEAENMQPFYQKSFALSKEISDVEGEIISGRGMALYYLLKKDFAKAKNYISESIRMADSVDLKSEKVAGLKVMANILFASNDIVGAEKLLDSSQVLENQLTGEEIQNKTLLIEKKFETQKKETQIQLQKAQLRHKNTLNYVFAGTALAILLISLLGYRNYKNKQRLQQTKIDELEKEKQLTATEAVLKGEEQERTRLAKDLHDGLGGMLSGIKFSLSNMKGNLIMTPDNAQAFERSIDMLDSSIKEMRRVAHNMMPEVLVKYGLDTALKEFCNEIDQSGVIHTNYHSMGMDKISVEQTSAITIYRIVQELVNNAIKHAAATNVLVQTQYSETEKNISITVEDDGKGFDKEALKKASGIGWSNIQNRVDFLKGKIDVQTGEGKGTSVLIEVNV
ncbi:MAG: sensor histidine kinase [Ferruginibacter sp.]|nr:sensor histidine kinase [Ferruginibacter sp.]